MRTLRKFIGDSLYTGAAATAATTAAVSACGQAEEGNPIAPLNAVSHIAWGDEAARRDEASWKYTATGLALNAAAVTGWAAIHEYLAGDRRSRTPARSLLAGAAVAGIAYVTDYFVVPKRFTPGFEKRLSGRSLLAVYTTLALGLALGDCCGKVARK